MNAWPLLTLPGSTLLLELSPSQLINSVLNSELQIIQEFLHVKRLQVPWLKHLPLVLPYMPTKEALSEKLSSTFTLMLTVFYPLS